MDTHSSHLAAQNRSRGSQTPSPSHSASASASSIHLKRKLSAANASNTDDHAPPFPPSSVSADTRDGVLTSNDDLDSISARGADSADSDSDSAPLDDDEEDGGGAAGGSSSIRNFTAARLENNAAAAAAVAAGRNSKIKTESNASVKVEKEDGVKDGVSSGGVSGGSGPNALGSGMGIGVKEDAVKIFTENIQTSGAYSAREESLKREVRVLLRYL